MPPQSRGSNTPTVIIRKKRTRLPSSGGARLRPEAVPAPSRQPPTATVNALRSPRPRTEQSLTSTPPPAPSAPASPAPTAQPSTRKAREVQQERAVLLLVQQRWPKLFPTEGRRRTPLAVGIHQELIAALPDVKPWRIRQLLRWWQGSDQGAYWRALLQGGPRYHLDGTPSGEVTDQEQAHARQQLAAFTQSHRARRLSPPLSHSEAAERQPPQPTGEASV